MEEKKELLDQDERVVEIELERLRGFVNHPFKVQADSQMIELQESIKKYGILNPLIVRPRQDGTYEIISGHRRKFAAEKIGYRKVPVIIRVLKDDEAVVSMVDSNLQREMISPSEKAFAYKMKYEAIKRKAGRRKCGQVDHNLGKKSIELIGEECGDSPKQVQRYIKITELIPEMLEKVDDGSMGFTPAVQLSFLKKKEQKEMLDTKLASINTHFMEKYYKDLLKMPAVKSTKNPDGTGTITESTVNEIHKVLRSCFRQAVKWDMMEKNPAVDATVPKAKKQEREIWTAEMLMQALEACDNKMLKIAFHLAFTATLRIGELLGLTWDDMDISEEAIADNKAYVIINKQVERVSKDAIEALNSKEIIMIFPSQKKNNKTVRVLKSPKTDSSKRKVFIPKSVAQCLIDLKKEQEEIIEALGNEYQNYNLVMATTFGLPIGDSYLRTKMQDIIDELGLPDVVFHSLRHTSVTYKLKLSGGDIKAVQGDSGHAQADMVTEVYGHILDEDRRKNAELMENAFYNKENLNPQMKAQDEGNSTITVPDGVDAELLMKVLGNPEMAALLTSLAKTMKV